MVTVMKDAAFHEPKNTFVYRVVGRANSIIYVPPGWVVARVATTHTVACRVPFLFASTKTLENLLAISNTCATGDWAASNKERSDQLRQVKECVTCLQAAFAAGDLVKS